MKTNRKLGLIALIVISSSVLTNCSSVNPLQPDNSDIKKKVEFQNFTFEATTILPNRGVSKMINGSNYYLKIRKDTVESYLPFWGVAYTAPLTTDDNGIKFTSLKFEYKLTTRPRGDWEIAIKPKDVKNDYSLFMSISKNGYASLRISSSNRESISFYGVVK